MDLRRTPNSRRAGSLLARALWIGLLGFLVWSETVFVGRWIAANRISWVSAGSVLCAIVIVGWIATSATALRARAVQVGGAPPAPPGAIADVDNLEDLGPEERRTDALLTPTDPLESVRAMNNLLGLELSSGEYDRPRVTLVRAGPAGVELLLDEARPDAPPSFQSADDGRVWRLREDVDPNVVLSARGASVPAFVPLLLRIGSDRDATFFVAIGRGESVGIAGDDTTDTLNRLVSDLRYGGWTNPVLYRIGDSKFDGSETVASLELDELEELDRTQLAAESEGAPNLVSVVVTDDRGLIDLLRPRLEHAVLLGCAVEADHLLYRSDDTITIEPSGLAVQLDPFQSVESTADNQRGAEGSNGQHDVAVGASDSVPRRGAVEVRILREHPDLVGDLAGPSHPIAVQFIAYLATHGGRATTSRLRDGIGSYRREESKANKTVWSAAGFARQAVGVDRIPNARGSQQYELTGDITCDWGRFMEAFQRGRSAYAARETPRAISLLSGALDLFEGLPGQEERRFEWLETEGILEEIQRVVEEAAHLLATIASESGSTALAKWAIERGRLANPDSQLLDTSAEL